MKVDYDHGPKYHLVGGGFNHLEKSWNSSMGRIIMDLSHLLWIIPSIIVIYHGLSWIIIFETTSHHLRMFALPTSFARAQHCTF
jgi:hypothetical protein